MNLLVGLLAAVATALVLGVVAHDDRAAKHDPRGRAQRSGLYFIRYRLHFAG
jgi:hypothetical protein